MVQTGVQYLRVSDFERECAMASRRGIGLYVLMLAGETDRDLFRHEHDIVDWETQLETALRLHDAIVHAYCWTAREAHIAVHLLRDPIHCFVRTLSGSAHCRRFDRTVSVNPWIGSDSHACRVVGDIELQAVIHRIHRHPLERGLTTNLDQYPWSSHRCYLRLDRRPWLDLIRLSQVLASLSVSYRAWMDATEASGDPAHVAACRSMDAFGELIKAVAQATHVSAIDIVSTRQHKPVVQARRLVVRIAADEHMATVEQIAQYLGACTASVAFAMRKSEAPQLDSLRAQVREALRASGLEFSGAATRSHGSRPMPAPLRTS